MALAFDPEIRVSARPDSGGLCLKYLQPLRKSYLRALILGSALSTAASRAGFVLGLSGFCHIRLIPLSCACPWHQGTPRAFTDTFVARFPFQTSISRDLESITKSLRVFAFHRSIQLEKQALLSPSCLLKASRDLEARSLPQPLRI